MKNLGILSALVLSASMIAPAAMAKNASPTVKTPARGGVVHQLRAPQASSNDGMSGTGETKAPKAPRKKVAGHKMKTSRKKVAGAKTKRQSKRAKVAHARVKKSPGRRQAMRHTGQRRTKAV